MQLKQFIVITRGKENYPELWDTKTYEEINRNNPDMFNGARILVTFPMDDEPPPASAVEEAARMYPKEIVVTKEHSEKFTFNQIAEMQRSAHIRCAGMYTDTIDKLKAEIADLKSKVANCIEFIK